MAKLLYLTGVPFMYYKIFRNRLNIFKQDVSKFQQHGYIDLTLIGHIMHNLFEWINA